MNLVPVAYKSIRLTVVGVGCLKSFYLVLKNCKQI